MRERASGSGYNGDGSVQVGVIATVSESKVAQSVQATNPAGNGGRHSQMRRPLVSKSDAFAVPGRHAPI